MTIFTIKQNDNNNNNNNNCIMQCQLKIRLKRKVFSLDLKVVIDLQLLISCGREFHNTGAIYENALWPYESNLTKGRVSSYFVQKIIKTSLLRPKNAVTWDEVIQRINHYGFRINKFFEVDFAIKVNASNERRFDRSTVIFKFGVRIKLHV